MTTCASLRAMASRASAANCTHECTHPLTRPRTCTTHTDTDTEIYTSSQGKRVSNSPCVHHRPSQQSQHPPIRPSACCSHYYTFITHGSLEPIRSSVDGEAHGCGKGRPGDGPLVGVVSVSRGKKGARASVLPFRAAFPEQIFVRLNLNQERHPVMHQVPLLIAVLNPMNG
jgi:hypothetical protein